MNPRPASDAAWWQRNVTDTKATVEVIGGKPVPTSVPNAATVRFV